MTNLWLFPIESSLLLLFVWWLFEFEKLLIRYLLSLNFPLLLLCLMAKNHFLIYQYRIQFLSYFCCHSTSCWWCSRCCCCAWKTWIPNIELPKCWIIDRSRFSIYINLLLFHKNKKIKIILRQKSFPLDAPLSKVT